MCLYGQVVRPSTSHHQHQGLSTGKRELLSDDEEEKERGSHELVLACDRTSKFPKRLFFLFTFETFLGGG